MQCSCMQAAPPCGGIELSKRNCGESTKKEVSPFGEVIRGSQASARDVALPCASSSSSLCSCSSCYSTETLQVIFATSLYRALRLCSTSAPHREPFPSSLHVRGVSSSISNLKSLVSSHQLQRTLTNCKECPRLLRITVVGLLRLGWWRPFGSMARWDSRLL